MPHRRRRGVLGPEFPQEVGEVCRLGLLHQPPARSSSGKGFVGGFWFLTRGLILGVCSDPIEIRHLELLSPWLQQLLSFKPQSVIYVHESVECGGTLLSHLQYVQDGNPLPVQFSGRL